MTAHAPSPYSNPTCAYGGTQAGKDAALAPLRTSMELGDLTQKSTSECLIARMAGGYNHKAAASLAGLAIGAVSMAEIIFEFSNEEDAARNGFNALNNIPPGADTSSCIYEALIWLLADPTHGLARYSRYNGAEACHAIILDTVGMLERTLSGTPVAESEWQQMIGRTSPIAQKAMRQSDRVIQTMMVVNDIAKQVIDTQHFYSALYQAIVDEKLIDGSIVAARFAAILAAAPVPAPKPVRTEERQLAEA